MEKRIFGATDGIRGKVGEAPLRPNAIKALGKAISKYFENGRLVVGRDTRVSGQWMCDAAVEGIKEQGGSVGDLGIVPTPAMQKIVGEREGIVGGIMMTASHNPATDNGLKVFLTDGDKLSDEQELQVEEYYFEQELGEDVDPPAVTYEVEDNPAAVRDYVEAADEMLEIGNELEGVELVVDAASGAGHDYSKAVFDEFGIEAEMIDPVPNGTNINDGCGALYPEKMAATAKERGCVGVAMDGDADRIILADEEGKIWDGDRIVCLIAEYLNENEALPNSKVVLTEYSNLATIQYLMNNGIEVDKVVNGDRFVAQKCEENGLILGGELSGHIIYLPWLKSSDATFMTLFILKIMREKGCRLADLWAKYDNLPSKQWGVVVREKKNLDELPEWIGAMAAAENRLDGNGRIFTRYSGTENKLRILVEGQDAEIVEEVGEALKELVEKELG